MTAQFVETPLHPVAPRGFGLDRIAPPPDMAFAVDRLTGLIGRSYFRLLAEPVWVRHRAGCGALSLLVVDIDDCKCFNGCYGHELGDRLIIHVADLCLWLKRPADLVARTAGEAFTLLLPDTDMAAARALADKLRRRVELSPLDERGLARPATVSIGAAEALVSTEDLAALVEAAQAALYAAKMAGRNRVMTPA
jgi:diguanylate cyclase (GGDEF)-like protein